ncbi:MAG: hypothetical protein LBG49_00775 [Mycoplasmataceae bacterium]|jgi:alanine dehydrogenase|nr:hypothetical protein [Mycoplasmataceae bacterium]
MRIGILKENKTELRIAITPNDVKRLVAAKNEVFVCANAGVANNFLDKQYIEAGAKIVVNNKKLIETCQVLLKLSAPTSDESKLLANKIIIGHYNLANNPKTLRSFLTNNITAIGIEAVNESGVYTILLPNEQIKGRFAAILGCYYLSKLNKNGMGKLFTSISYNESPAKFVVVNASYAGIEAAKTILSFGADLTILENNTNLLDQVHQHHILHELAKLNKAKLKIVNADYSNLTQYIAGCDVLIYTNSTPGSLTSKRITNPMITSMNKGGVFVDIAIDQGVSSDDEKRPTKINKPCFVGNDITHFAFDNVPALFNQTISVAISKLLTDYLLECDHTKNDGAILKHKYLSAATLTHRKKITNKNIATSLRLEYTNLSSIS